MEILDKVKVKENKNVSPFSEHNFLASALKIGLTYSDLEKIKYKDVLKVLIVSSDLMNDIEKEATPEEIKDFINNF